MNKKLSRLKKISTLHKESFFFQEKSIQQLEEAFSEVQRKLSFLSEKQEYDKDFGFIDEIKLNMLTKKINDLAYQIDLIETGNNK
jgi:hypothetical protein